MGAWPFDRNTASCLPGLRYPRAALGAAAPPPRLFGLHSLLAHRRLLVCGPDCAPTRGIWDAAMMRTGTPPFFPSPTHSTPAVECAPQPNLLSQPHMASHTPAASAAFVASGLPLVCCMVSTPAVLLLSCPIPIPPLCPSLSFCLYLCSLRYLYHFLCLCLFLLFAVFLAVPIALALALCLFTNALGITSGERLGHPKIVCP